MDQIVLVTGGSSGIGASTCRLLARQGYLVVVNYRSKEHLAHNIAAEIMSGGGKAILAQGDISDEQDVMRIFETIDAKAGRITALVNNAGVVGRRDRFQDLDLETIKHVINVNLVGSMICAREAIKRMSTRNGGSGGSIVNISSGLSNTGGALSAESVFLPGGEGKIPSIAYACAKGAINTFTMALAQEVARQGIRVNTVSPGVTYTAMPDPEIMADIERSIPMGRGAQPGEIAEVIAWLLSDKASYVSGAYVRAGGARIG